MPKPMPHCPCSLVESQRAKPARLLLLNSVHPLVLCVVQKYGLEQTSWDELATWPFADFVFNQPSDWFQNCNKLKQTGFDGMKVDTDQVCEG